MLELVWDDDTVTTVDRRRTIGAHDRCDTTLPDVASVAVLVEPVGQWVLVEQVAAATDAGADLAANDATVTGRRVLDDGDVVTLGSHRATVRVVEVDDAVEGLLTDRQLDVLSCFGDGNTAEQAAERLGVSINTVHSHVQSAYRRLGVSSKQEALGVAFTRGIFPDRRTGDAHPDGLYAGLLASRGEDPAAALPNPSSGPDDDDGG